ncbi:MAG: hypothetical protein AAFV88_05305 [Planctomycetota bacterium]
MKSVATILIGALLLLPVGLVVMQACGRSPRPLIDHAINSMPVTLTSSLGLRSAEPVVLGDWPPKRDEVFPDLVLHDQDGNPTRLSEFAGKIILVEYAAIPCVGCQAFAGGMEKGPFGGFQTQPGLESIDVYAKRFAGVELGTEDIVFVQVLLYGESNSAPTQREVAGWAAHFEMNRAENRIVLRGDASMLSRETYDMIPGFHVIDRDFVLRADSCGHQPLENLYTELLPKLGELARQ